MSQLMEFVSCIAMVNEGEFGEDEHGLCKIQIKDGALLETLDENNLSELKIQNMLISEGTEIFSKGCFGINDVRIFAGENIDKEYKKYVWYELLKMLTGHRVYIASLDKKVVFTKWTCRMQNDELWKVVMELESSAIIRKIAELTLHPVTNGEADLFEMADKLYQDICYVNDSYRNMKESNSSNRNRVEELTRERELLDKLLEERDERTRTMVVALLNEKKKKIRELHEILRRNNIKLSDDDVSDSTLINMEVAKPISELNSPGKRLKQRRTVEPQNLNEKLKDINRRRANRRISNHSAIKSEDDDFDDFQFFGLSKRPIIASKDKLSENDYDTGSASSMSDSSNDNRKHLAFLEENGIQLSAGRLSENHGAIPGSESETDASAEEKKNSNNSEQGGNDKESCLQTESETDIDA
uniref:LIF1 n=1 Tax=Saccharomyces cariocanus TaxID=114526 RepID=A0SQ70_9SACH|nr:LIF1 [Saccharomyces cariocanus]